MPKNNKHLLLHSFCELGIQKWLHKVILKMWPEVFKGLLHLKYLIDMAVDRRPLTCHMDLVIGQLEYPHDLAAEFPPERVILENKTKIAMSFIVYLYHTE